jgi:hypothetical protein
MKRKGVAYVIDDVGGVPVRYGKRFRHLAGGTGCVRPDRAVTDKGGRMAQTAPGLPSPNYGR